MDSILNILPVSWKAVIQAIDAPTRGLLALVFVFAFLIVLVGWAVWGVTKVDGGPLIMTGIVFSGALGFCAVIMNSNHQDSLRRRGEEEKRKEQKKALAAALAGEAQSVLLYINSSGNELFTKIKQIESGTTAEQELLWPGGAIKLPPWPEPSTIVFEANAGRIGILGVKMAHELAVRYGKLARWKDENSDDTKKTDFNERLGQLRDYNRRWKWCHERLIAIAGVEETEEDRSEWVGHISGGG